MRYNDKYIFRKMISFAVTASLTCGTLMPQTAFAGEMDGAALFETERVIDFGAVPEADAIPPVKDASTVEDAVRTMDGAASEADEVLQTDQDPPAEPEGASGKENLPADTDEASDEGGLPGRKAQEKREKILISDAKDLEALAQRCSVDRNSENLEVVLTSDINLAGKKTVPIPYFSGIFDGQGHTLKGAVIRSEGSCLGVFRYIGKGAVVRNLNVEGRNEPGGSASSIGGIAGSNEGIILNCSYKGNISAQENGGGIAGVNAESGLISGCRFEGKVSSQHRAGGICGQNQGSVLGCTNEGRINTEYIETDAQTRSSIAQSLSNPSSFDISSVSAEDFVDIMDIGGICGYSEGLISECRNTGAVGYAHTGYNTGGICGRSSGFTVACTNEGDVSGRKDIGGILGQLEPESIWEYSQSRVQELKDELITLNALIDQLAYDVSGSTDAVKDKVGSASTFAQDTISDLQDITDDVGNDVETTSAAISSLMGQLQQAVNEQDAQALQDALGQLAQLVAEADPFRTPISVSVKGDTQSDLNSVLNAREGEWWKKLDEYLNSRQERIGQGTTGSWSLPSGEGTFSLPDSLPDPASAGALVSDIADGVQDITDDIVRNADSDTDAAGNGSLPADIAAPENGSVPVDIIAPGTDQGSVVEDLITPVQSAVSDIRSGQEIISDEASDNARQEQADSSLAAPEDDIQSPMLTGVIDGGRGEDGVFAADTSAVDENYSDGMFEDVSGSPSVSDTGNEGDIVAPDTGSVDAVAQEGAVVSDGGVISDPAVDAGADPVPEESILTGSGMDDEEGLIVEEPSGTNIVDYQSDLSHSTQAGDLYSSDRSRNSNVKVDVDTDFPDTAQLRALLQAILADSADLLDPAALANAQQILADLQIDAPDTESFYRNFQSLAGAIVPIANEASSMTGKAAADIDAITDQMDLVTGTFFDLTESISADDLDERYQQMDVSELDPYQSDASSIERCSNTGQVSGDTNVGGVCGCIGFENKIDAEGVLDVSDYLLKDARYTVFAAQRQCRNAGAVTAKKEAAGGICAFMEFGIVTDSVNTGAIQTQEGNYCGGISGDSRGTITDSCAGSLLSGNAYVGGIAGNGTNIRNCISYSYIGKGTEYLGAIAGKAEGKVSGCEYVDYGIGGVDNIGYAGVAQPVQPDAQASAVQAESDANVLPRESEAADVAEASSKDGQTEDTAEASFNKGQAERNDETLWEQAGAMENSGTGDDLSFGTSCKVTFLVEDEVYQTIRVPFGGSLETLPEVPKRGTDYWEWDDFDREHIFQDQSVSGAYHRATTTLASGGDVPDCLVEGIFYKGQTLTVEPYRPEESPVSTESIAEFLEDQLHRGKSRNEKEAPDEEEAPDEKLPAETETEPSGSRISRAKEKIRQVITDRLTGPLIDARTLSVNDYEDDLTVRAKLQSGGRLFTAAPGASLQETTYRKDGSYIVFSLPNNGSYAYYETVRQDKDMRWKIYAVCGGSVGAVLLLVLLIRRHRRKKGKG